MIYSNLLFKVILRLSGNDKKVQFGEYSFKESVKLLEIIETLINGNYYYRKIIIPECSTVEKILEIIESNNYLSGSVLEQPTEGSIFPDTYFFQRDDDKNKIILRMQNKMDREVNIIWKNKNSILNSKLDLIKLASLIEAEAIENNEKYIISSVFHNRIKKGMKLQSDPTVLYSKNLNSKIKSRKIFKNDLLSDNPWNTYTREGLPLTPICNPGREAIDAAMNPRSTSFIYFVANGVGGHRFSSNYKKHLKNIKLWKNKIRDINEIK